MISVTKFKEENNFNHWDLPALEGYMYDNVFDDQYHQKLKNHVEQILANNSTKTFLTHGTIFKVKEEQRKIVSQSDNHREQNVIYDISFDIDWFYQTQDTIKQWATKKIYDTVDPYFAKFLNTMESLPPMSDEPHKWIPYRLHLNKLDYEEFLSLHIDCGFQIYKTYEAYDARVNSITYYLQDHQEGEGGELFSINGFVYRPKKNSAILINGNQAVHGINANMNKDKKKRLAFTTRWAYIDDLLLPGSPDLFIYKFNQYRS